MKSDVIIVGSGLAGATAANQLATSGLKVLVVEKNNHIGGQCYDLKNDDGITIHQYGPHIFHTSKETVWEYINQFTSFSGYYHRVLSFTQGEYYPFPINRDTINKVFKVTLSEDEMMDFLATEVEKAKYNSPAHSFRDAMVAQIGEKLYAQFIENYTRKQWACEPDTLSAELAGRIIIRKDCNDGYFTDTHQGIPENGYTAMIEAMLKHDNIQVLLNTDYLECKEQMNADLVVYTGALDCFFGEKYGKLEYRSVRLDMKTFEKESFQPVAVVNYPNEEEWTRITEFKKLTGEKSAVTTVCYEYPDADGLPFYVVPTRRNTDLRTKYMQEVDVLEATGNYLFIGRLAEYKYYNMDDVIAASLEKTKRWIDTFRKS